MRSRLLWRRAAASLGTYLAVGLGILATIVAAHLLGDKVGRLSRGIAGVRGQAIVLNTPGSPKGCVEQLEAVLDILPHALGLLAETPTEH